MGRKKSRRKSGLVLVGKLVAERKGKERGGGGLYMACGRWRAGLRRIKWDDEVRHGPNKDNAEK